MCTVTIWHGTEFVYFRHWIIVAPKVFKCLKLTPDMLHLLGTINPILATFIRYIKDAVGKNNMRMHS